MKAGHARLAVALFVSVAVLIILLPTGPVLAQESIEGFSRDPQEEQENGRYGEEREGMRPVHAQYTPRR